MMHKDESDDCEGYLSAHKGINLNYISIKSASASTHRL